MVQDRAIFTRPIESRIWSIERRHFQWPWTTPNLVFKVTPFLTLNISQTATNTAIVTIEGNRKPHLSFRMALISMTLNDLLPTFQGLDNIQRPVTCLIVSRMVYRTCHFQRSWTTRTPDFKFMPLCDAEYLRNGTRFIHSFNGIVTGTYTRLSVKGAISNDLEWPWVTWRNIHWHEAAGGLYATAELLVWYTWHSTPMLVDPSEYCHTAWYAKTGMAWLLNG